jgi:hypothetical protein
VIKEPPIKIEEKPGADEFRFSTFYGGNVKEKTGIDYDTLYDNFARTGSDGDYEALVDAYLRLLG